MKLHWEDTLRTFRPKEAAFISEVSEFTQRDWRRKGLIYSKRSSGWSELQLGDVLDLVVIKRFKDANFSTKDIKTLAWHVTAGLLLAVKRHPRLIGTEGVVLRPDEHPALIREIHGEDPGPEFVHLRLPQPPEGDEGLSALIGHRPEDMAAVLNREPGFSSYLSFDLRRMADEIADRVDRPLVIYRLTEIAE